MVDFSIEKLKDVIHYVSYKAHSSELGKVKLNKVLWYSDAFFYIKHKRSITGETYVKSERGPMSKHILDALQQLRDEGRLVETNVEYFGYRKKEYVPLVNPPLDSFSPEEVSLIDGVIDFVCHQNSAVSISEITHNAIWELADMNEEIPYCAVIVGKLEPVSDEDIEWAKSFDSVSEAEPA